MGNPLAVVSKNKSKVSAPTAMSLTVQANVNAIIDRRFRHMKPPEVARHIGFDYNLLWKVRKDAKVLSQQKLEELAAALGENYYDLVTPNRYDSLDNAKKIDGVNSPDTPDQSIVASPITQKAGGHGLSPSAERRRIQQLEGFIASLIKLTETKANEMRGVLHAGQSRRAARKKA